MRACAFLLALILAATPAFAQRGERDKGGKAQGMSKDERQRMRDDMRDVYRDRGGDRNRQDRPAQRPLSPQEREKLRRDIQDANRDLRR
ncbi:MAG: hypothetical protein ABR570_16780 [Burkholderiales bacterium]